MGFDRPLALIKNADFFKSGAGVGWKCLGADYYNFQGQCKLYYVWVLSYMKILQEVNKKMRRILNMDGLPYSILRLSDINIQYNTVIKRVLPYLEENGYIRTMKKFGVIYFHAEESLPTIRRKPLDLFRLPLYSLPPQLTVTDALILENIYRKWIVRNRGSKFVQVNYTELADRIGCSVKTIARRIRNLYIEDFLHKNLRVKKGKSFAYFYPKLALGHIPRHDKLSMEEMTNCPSKDIYNINTSYLYYLSLLNTPYLIDLRGKPLTFGDRYPLPVTPSAIPNFCLKESGIKPNWLYLIPVIGGLMKNLKDLEEKIRRQHQMKQVKNVTDMSVLIKSFFPEDFKRSVLLPVERNQLKGLKKVLDAEKVSFQQFLETLSKIRPSINGFAAKILSQNFIQGLCNPSVVDTVLAEVKKDKRPKRYPLGVVVPVEAVFAFYNEDIPPCIVEYSDGLAVHVDPPEAVRIIKETKRARLSSPAVREEFIRYLCNKGKDIEDYEDSIAYLATLNVPSALTKAYNRLKKM